jgi:hypothetical protein
VLLYKVIFYIFLALYLEILVLVRTHNLNGSAVCCILLPPLYTPARNWRSSSKNLLETPRIDSANGQRSFSYAAPAIFNSLPEQIRSSPSLSVFRAKLKTHLFPP